MQSYEAGEFMEVNTRALRNSGEELHRAGANVRYIGEHLFEIEHRLRDLSGMEGIIYAMKKEEHRLERLSMTLRQMGIALEDISWRYEVTEEAIAEHSEVIILYNTIKHHFPEIIKPIPKMIFAYEIHSLRKKKRYLNLINLRRK